MHLQTGENISEAWMAALCLIARKRWWCSHLSYVVTNWS